MDVEECRSLAKTRRAAGDDWNAILADLVASGASRLDITRTVRDVAHVETGAATTIGKESGAVEPWHFEVHVSEGDPWYDAIFGEQTGKDAPTEDAH